MKIKRIIEIEEKDFEQICEVANDTKSRLGIVPLASSIIVQSKPYDDSGDLISRSELKRVLGDTLYRSTIKDYGEILKYTFVMDCIDNATAVAYPFEKFRTMLCGTCQAYMRIEPDRPSGEWIIVKDKKYGDNFKCPFCGKELAGTDLNFCCKCGAKLRRKLP